MNNFQQVVASGAWKYDTFIPFDKQNADGTCPNIDSVVAGTNGSLVLNTDYFKTKDPATGKWGITARDSSTITTESQSLTIQYDYTPSAKATLSGGTSQTATPRYVKIVGPSEDDANVTRTVWLDAAIATSAMLLPFLDVEGSGDVGVMPVTFESNKATAWNIEDEINP